MRSSISAVIETAVEDVLKAVLRCCEVLSSAILIISSILCWWTYQRNTCAWYTTVWYISVLHQAMIMDVLVKCHDASAAGSNAGGALMWCWCCWRWCRWCLCIHRSIHAVMFHVYISCRCRQDTGRKQSRMRRCSNCFLQLWCMGFWHESTLPSLLVLSLFNGILVSCERRCEIDSRKFLLSFLI